jgi:hypothetical protein
MFFIVSGLYAESNLYMSPMVAAPFPASTVDLLL